VLRHFAKLHVAALYQADNKLAHRLLAEQVAHKLGLLQKRRNFGSEVLLHGAERVFSGWNPKGRTAPFFCLKFSRVQYQNSIPLSYKFNAIYR
jgi:hypothetical protein